MKKIFGLIICCFILCIFSSCEKEYKDYFYAKKYPKENQWSIQDTIKIYNSDGCDISVAKPNQIIPYLAKFNRNKIGDPPYIGFYPGNISFDRNYINLPNIINGSVTSLPMMAYKDGPLDTLYFSFEGLIRIINLRIVTRYNIYIDSINVSLESVFMNGVFHINYQDPRSFRSYSLTHYDYDEKGTNTTKINVQDSIQDTIFYIPVPNYYSDLHHPVDYGKLTVILFTNEGIIRRTTKESINFQNYDTRYHCDIILY